MNHQDNRKFLAENMAQLGNHVMRSAESQSWYLHGFDKEGRRTSFCAYSITWAKPGVLTLSGDLGELTLTHVHAMPTLDEALKWLSGSDYDYHLGKSGVAREFDPHQTMDMWLRLLNEYAVPSFKHWRDEMRSYRASLMDDPDPTGEHKPKQSDWWERDKEEWSGWRKLATHFHYSETDVLTQEGRWHIKDELRSVLESGIHGYSDLAWTLFDDPPACTEWPRQRIMQMAAIYRWADLMRENMPAKMVDGDLYASAVT